MNSSYNKSGSVQKGFSRILVADLLSLHTKFDAHTLLDFAVQNTKSKRNVCAQTLKSTSERSRGGFGECDLDLLSPPLLQRQSQ